MKQKYVWLFIEGKLARQLIPKNVNEKEFFLCIDEQLYDSNNFRCKPIEELRGIANE